MYCQERNHSHPRELTLTEWGERLVSHPSDRRCALGFKFHGESIAASKTGKEYDSLYLPRENWTFKFLNFFFLSLFFTMLKQAISCVYIEALGFFFLFYQLFLSGIIGKKFPGVTTEDAVATQLAPDHSSGSYGRWFVAEITQNRGSSSRHTRMDVLQYYVLDALRTLWCTLQL